MFAYADDGPFPMPPQWDDDDVGRRAEGPPEPAPPPPPPVCRKPPPGPSKHNARNSHLYKHNQVETVLVFHGAKEGVKNCLLDVTNTPDIVVSKWDLSRLPPNTTFPHRSTSSMSKGDDASRCDPPSRSGSNASFTQELVSTCSKMGLVSKWDLSQSQGAAFPHRSTSSMCDRDDDTSRGPSQSAGQATSSDLATRMVSKWDLSRMLQDATFPHRSTSSMSKGDDASICCIQSRSGSSTSNIKEAVCRREVLKSKWDLSQEAIFPHRSASSVCEGCDGDTSGDGGSADVGHSKWDLSRLPAGATLPHRSTSSMSKDEGPRGQGPALIQLVPPARGGSETVVCDGGSWSGDELTPAQSESEGTVVSKHVPDEAVIEPITAPLPAADSRSASRSTVEGDCLSTLDSSRGHRSEPAHVPVGYLSRLPPHAVLPQMVCAVARAAPMSAVVAPPEALSAVSCNKNIVYSMCG